MGNALGVAPVQKVIAMFHYYGHTKNNCTTVFLGQEFIGEIRRAFAKYHAYPAPKGCNPPESAGSFSSMESAGLFLHQLHVRRKAASQ